MDEINMLEAMGEALDLKNAKIKELSYELGIRAGIISDLRHKLMLAEAENIRLRRAMEAMEWYTP